MKAVISKWGDNLGIEIPVMITETLGLQAGDQVDIETMNVVIVNGKEVGK